MPLRTISEADQPHLPGPADTGNSPGSLRFFSRTGHSFLAQDAQGIQGYVLAQAVWQGERVTVLITRLVANEAAVYRQLLEGVVKSAYDAGVYEVALHLVPPNPPLQEALASTGFTMGPAVLASRRLGKAGAEGPAHGILS
jgi:hypothetical protein